MKSINGKQSKNFLPQTIVTPLQMLRIMLQWFYTQKPQLRSAAPMNKCQQELRTLLNARKSGNVSQRCIDLLLEVIEIWGSDHEKILAFLIMTVTPEALNNGSKQLERLIV